MNRRALALWIGAGICAALFAFAFAAAPKSCEWGLEAYTWSGIAALLVLLVIPIALRADRPVGIRVLLGFGFAVCGFAAWFGGLLASNMQILCRLF